MTDEQLAALREAYDWLQFATFNYPGKSLAEFMAMIDGLEAAFPLLREECNRT